MTHPSKRKGVSFERELVDIAKARGLSAKRAWGSNGQALGMHDEVDLVVEEVKVQAKRRARLASYMKPSEHVDAVAMREDRGECLLVVRYEDYLDLLIRAEMLRKADARTYRIIGVSGVCSGDDAGAEARDGVEASGQGDLPVGGDL